MSFQAITDIIVNPQQLQDLQVSNTVKDSPKTTSTVSFADMLSSIQNEKTSEPVKNEEKTTAVQEERPVEKEETVSKSEETPKSEKPEEKKLVSEDKKEVAKEKVDTKSDVKVSVNEVKEEKLPESEKKLTAKDFARLNQLTGKEDSEKETVIDAALVAENVKVDPKIEKSTPKVEAEIEVETPEVQIDAQQMVASNQQMDNEASEFNFSENHSEKRQNTLDKEGKITVQDLRTEPSEEIKLEAKDQLKITEVKQTGENTAQITIDLNQNANADVLSLNSQSAAADGSNFQAMLNNQIQNNAPEFVKAGNLILKDNNQGTIDLVLHPDDLGNVKIHLSLDGKTISGQITVNSKEALQVFKDNAETLREAFIKNGFDGASFDVAFNNGGSSNQGFEFGQQNDGTNLLGKRVYGNSAEAVSGDFDGEYLNDENYSNYSVNIVA